MADDLVQSPVTTLRRRNSISNPVKIPPKLTLYTPKPLETATSLPNGAAYAAPSPLDLELITLKGSFASYTSLRDILPSPTVAVNSPTAANSGYEISIRNRLVKQAAWAYLQPMSVSPDSTGPHFFRRFWLRFSSTSCFRFFQLKIIPGLTPLVDRFIRSIITIFTR